MNSKLLIIAVSGLATIGSMFLFNSNQPPKQQTANLVEAAITPSPSITPKRFDLGSPKRSNLGSTKPKNIQESPLHIPSLAPDVKVEPLSNQGSTLTSPIPTLLPKTPLTPTPTPAPATTSTPETPAPSSTPISETSASAPTPTSEQSGKININTADKIELDKITGVGPVIAQRIIDYRNSNGPFQKIEDLKNVKGIGDVNFEKMKDEITI